MFKKQKLLKVEQFILDQVENVQYPQTFQALEEFWECLLVSALSEQNLQKLSEKEKSQIKDCTFPLMLIHNKSKIKLLTQEFMVLSASQSFRSSLKVTSFDDFSLFWQDEVLKFQETLSKFLNDFQAKHSNIERLKFKFFQSYLKEVEKMLLTDESRWPKEYKNRLVDIFYRYENLLVFDEVLQKPPELHEQELNRILVWMSEEIQEVKVLLLKLFPDCIFNRYLTWFFKGIKKTFNEKIEERGKMIQESFLDHSSVFVFELAAGDKKEFDQLYCSQDLKNVIYSLVIYLCPKELPKNDRNLQRLIFLLRGAQNLAVIAEDFNSTIDLHKCLKDFWNQSSEQSRNFLITSAAFTLAGLPNDFHYSSLHRELLYKLISTTLFPYSKSSLNTSLLRHLESLLSKYSNSLKPSSKLFTFDSGETSSFFSVFSSKKKKSLKLLNILPKPSLSSLIIIPGNSLTKKSSQAKLEAFTSIVNQSETFLYKWNPLHYFSGVLQIVPNLVNTGYNVYSGNLFGAFRSALSTLTNSDLAAFKTQAKSAASDLAKFLKTEEFSNKPVSIVADCEGCQVAFYLLKEMSRGPDKLHQVFLINNQMEKKNWKHYKNPVVGRFVNCVKKGFSPLKIAAFKNPVSLTLIEGAENIELKKGEVEYPEVLKLMNF